MLDISRVIPSVVIRSILVVASLILIMQIGLFTWLAVADCSEESSLEDNRTVLWCVYEGKIIKILPTAAIFAVIVSFGFQVVVIYGRSVLRDSPTIADYIALFREHQWRRLARELYHTMLLILLPVFVILELSSLSSHIPNAVLILLISGLFWNFIIAAWTNWFVRWVRSEKDDDQRAKIILVDQRLYRRRRSRILRTPRQDNDEV